MSSAADVTQSSIDEESGSIYLFGAVDEGMVQIAIPAISRIDLSDSPEECPLHVHLMTDGGMLSCGLAIYDALRSTRRKVFTHAHGDVLSSGVIIFLAGDQRTVSENTSMMFHRPCATPQHSHAGAHHDTCAHLDRDEERIERIFAEAGCPGVFGDLSGLTSDLWLIGADVLIDRKLAHFCRPCRLRPSAD